MRLGPTDGYRAQNLISVNPRLSQLPMHRPGLMQTEGYVSLGRGTRAIAPPHKSDTLRVLRIWLRGLL